MRETYLSVEGGGEERKVLLGFEIFENERRF